MEVDEENGEEKGEEDEDEDEEDEEDGGDTEPEDDSMAVDGDGEGPPRPPLKPRQSMINLEALADEQAVAALREKEYIQKKMAKRYFKEGLLFIELVETAMETIEKLLGSKSKPEVLEAIDFFRIAHTYDFVGAQVFSLCALPRIRDLTKAVERNQEDAAFDLVQGQ